MKLKASRKAVTVAVCGLGLATSTGVLRAQQLAAVTLPSPLPAANTAAVTAPPLPEAPAPSGFVPAAGRPALFEQAIDVSVREEVKRQSPDDGISQHAEARQVEMAAGAFSDIPRFLQTMPSVAFDSDARNTYLVNGGNPTENLYVLDGVEIANINHIGTNGSSGGFVSVIDTNAISDMTLHKQLYSSEYSGTLSSVLDMHTRMPEDDKRHGEVDLGFAGASFMLEQPVGRFITTMTQVRHSVVNYLTDDIGIDGVPDYHSVLSSSTIALGGNDSLKTLFLSSGDKLAIHSNLEDTQDPNTVDTTYGGNRDIGAITWHRSNDNGGSDLQLSYSTVSSTTAQVNAYVDNAPVYSDNLNESAYTLKYDAYRETSRVKLQGGFSLSVHPTNYRIDQAQGYPSPYTTDPTPLDASNTAFQGNLRNDAVYGEATVRAIGRLELQGGLRFERWGVNNSTAWMPRAGFKFSIGKRSFFFGGVGSYSQMPSLPVMLGYASNMALSPIHNLQTQFGFSGMDRFGGHFQTSVYGRRYSDYPVSTEFSSLSLADMIDPFGQPILYMPMVSAGRGRVTGVEMQYDTNLHRRIFGQMNLSSSKVEHQALDGVWRRANFDMPILGNVLAGVNLTRRQILTSRYSYHTGTPYTPFAMTPSSEQDRPIYDMSQINAKRGGVYSRLDLRYEINLPIHHKNLKIFAGMENVLDRRNYYQYIILHFGPGSGPYELTQLGRQMDGGMSWSF